MTTKADIDIFRATVLLGGSGIANPAAIDAALQAGIGTAADLAAFEAAAGAGGGASGPGGAGRAGALGRGGQLGSASSSPATNSSTATTTIGGLIVPTPGAPHPLATAQLGDALPTGPFRGLIRSRLAAPEIRQSLAKGEAARKALYAAYVGTNPLAASAAHSAVWGLGGAGGSPGAGLPGSEVSVEVVAGGVPAACAPLVIATGMPYSAMPVAAAAGSGGTA